MTTSSIERAIPCTFLGKTRATELADSKGKKKLRLVLGYYTQEEKDNNLGSKDRNIKDRAVVISTSKLKIFSKWFRSNRYAKMFVLNQDGMAKWVDVNLKSLSKRYGIDLDVLQTAANQSPNRNITQFLIKHLSEDLHYIEMSTQELMGKDRIKYLKPTTAQKRYELAYDIGSDTGKARIYLMEAVEGKHVPAMYDFARICLKDKREKKARKLLAIASKKGHVPSKLLYGILLIRHEASFEQGIQQLRSAAEQYKSQIANVILRYVGKITNEEYLYPSDPTLLHTFIAKVIIPKKMASSIEEFQERINQRVSALEEKDSKDKELIFLKSL